MRRFVLTLAALVVAGPLWATDLVVREVLQEQPLTDAEQMKVVVTRITLKPGGEVAQHVHPGDEHTVILQGGAIELPDGAADRYESGEALFVSAGEPHGGVKNIGEGDIVMLSTHVVNVLEPFSWPAE